MTNKLLSYLSPVIQVLTLILVIVIVFSGNSNLGGTTNYDAIDVTDGYSVDSTTVIDGSGNLTITGTRTITGAGENRLNMPRQTGSVLTIASSSVDTLTAAQVCDNSVIAKNSWDGVASGTAITNLPTAATMYSDCLTTNGDTYSIVFRNLHTTAGSSTLIVAGASTTLVGVDGNADIINGANEAVIKFIRYSATELIAVITEYTAAD